METISINGLNSTIAIINGKLDTKILSIDPCPRAEVDILCDTVIREPFQDIDVSLFEELEKGDVLFIDSSHQVFMNSDVTAIFLDVLPILKPGVIVHFHDIFLPVDYPLAWQERFYSEQYMLAVYLLNKECSDKIIFPCRFVVMDSLLKQKISKAFPEERFKRIRENGCSFWLEM